MIDMAGTIVFLGISKFQMNFTKPSYYFPAIENDVASNKNFVEFQNSCKIHK